LFLIFAAFYYDSVLDKGPLNAHIWRQTDCLSITRNYAEGADFLKPEVNCLLADDFTSGRTAGEFPILYYGVGMFWKYFGESYFSFRLFYLLILFAGLFSFYKSLRILLNDHFWAISISALLFTSPLFVVYGISFVTDVPAFSFVLIALYYLLEYHLKHKRKLFFLSMAFFALAGLLKISSLIAFVFILFILLIESLSVKSLTDKKLFKCDRYEWLGFISVILAIFSWYYYAEYYNTLHRMKYTFNSIYPIWNMKRENIGGLLRNVNNFPSYVFFSSSVLSVLLFIGIQNLFLWKKIPVFAFLSNVLIIVGSFLYFILWGPLMGNHDYYYAALLIIFVGILLPFIWFIKTNHNEFIGDT